MAVDDSSNPSEDARSVADDDAASVHSTATEDSDARAEREAQAAAEALYQKSLVQENRHVLRHQIWSVRLFRCRRIRVDSMTAYRSDSYNNYGWQPFDPASYVPPKAAFQDPHNYFYANLRRRNASGAYSCSTKLCFYTLYLISRPIRSFARDRPQRLQRCAALFSSVSTLLTLYHLLLRDDFIAGMMQGCLREPVS